MQPHERGSGRNALSGPRSLASSSSFTFSDVYRRENSDVRLTQATVTPSLTLISSPLKSNRSSMDLRTTLSMATTRAPAAPAAPEGSGRRVSGVVSNSHLRVLDAVRSIVPASAPAPAPPDTASLAQAASSRPNALSRVQSDIVHMLRHQPLSDPPRTATATATAIATANLPLPNTSRREEANERIEPLPRRSGTARHAFIGGAVAQQLRMATATASPSPRPHTTRWALRTSDVYRDAQCEPPIPQSSVSQTTHRTSPPRSPFQSLHSYQVDENNIGGLLSPRGHGHGQPCGGLVEVSAFIPEPACSTRTSVSQTTHGASPPHSPMQSPPHMYEEYNDINSSTLIAGGFVNGPPTSETPVPRVDVSQTRGMSPKPFETEAEKTDITPRTHWPGGLEAVEAAANTEPLSQTTHGTSTLHTLQVEGCESVMTLTGDSAEFVDVEVAPMSDTPPVAPSRVLHVARGTSPPRAPRIEDGTSGRPPLTPRGRTSGGGFGVVEAAVSPISVSQTASVETWPLTLRGNGIVEEAALPAERSVSQTTQGTSPPEGGNPQDDFECFVTKAAEMRAAWLKHQLNELAGTVFASERLRREGLVVSEEVAREVVVLCADQEPRARMAIHTRYVAELTSGPRGQRGQRDPYIDLDAPPMVSDLSIVQYFRYIRMLLEEERRRATSMLLDLFAAEQQHRRDLVARWAVELGIAGPTSGPLTVVGRVLVFNATGALQLSEEPAARVALQLRLLHEHLQLLLAICEVEEEHWRRSWSVGSSGSVPAAIASASDAYRVAAASTDLHLLTATGEATVRDLSNGGRRGLFMLAEDTVRADTRRHEAIQAAAHGDLEEPLHRPYLRSRVALPCPFVILLLCRFPPDTPTVAALAVLEQSANAADRPLRDLLARPDPDSEAWRATAVRHLAAAPAASYAYFPAHVAVFSASQLVTVVWPQLWQLWLDCPALSVRRQLRALLAKRAPAPPRIMAVPAAMPSVSLPAARPSAEGPFLGIGASTPASPLREVSRTVPAAPTAPAVSTESSLSMSMSAVRRQEIAYRAAMEAVLLALFEASDATGTRRVRLSAIISAARRLPDVQASLQAQARTLDGQVSAARGSRPDGVVGSLSNAHFVIRHKIQFLGNLIAGLRLDEQERTSSWSATASLLRSRFAAACAADGGADGLLGFAAFQGMMKGIAEEPPAL